MLTMKVKVERLASLANPFPQAYFVGGLEPIIAAMVHPEQVTSL